jgi:methylthioribose-1-phosphate isomerase
MRAMIKGLPATLSGSDFAQRCLTEAIAIHDEDRATCRAIGANGLRYVKKGMSIETHCNAGGLATAERGTALAVIYAAHEAGLGISVLVDETRPLLQGARLTAFELQAAGVPAIFARPRLDLEGEID